MAATEIKCKRKHISPLEHTDLLVIKFQPDFVAFFKSSTWQMSTFQHFFYLKCRSSLFQALPFIGIFINLRSTICDHSKRNFSMNKIWHRFQGFEWVAVYKFNVWEDIACCDRNSYGFAVQVEIAQSFRNLASISVESVDILQLKFSYLMQAKKS